ncbi:MAG: hypothetical protein ACTHNP_07070 [Solirubrobacterales bacterium]
MHGKLRRKAGKAAPFLVSGGDNSIPTYGTEASAAVRQQAEGSLSRYLYARAAGEWSVACSLMSAQVVRQLAVFAGENDRRASTCAKAYAAIAERESSSERADPMVGAVVSLRVESPHGFALFFGAGKQQLMMPLEEEGGGWKVSQITPISWPVGAPAGSSR